MSRPRKARLLLQLNPESLRAAQMYLGLCKPSYVVEAGLLALLAGRRERLPGERVFIDLASQPPEAIAQALADGYRVSFAHRGRLVTIRPGTLRAGRLLRRLSRASIRGPEMTRRQLFARQVVK